MATNVRPVLSMYLVQGQPKLGDLYQNQTRSNKQIKRVYNSLVILSTFVILVLILSSATVDLLYISLLEYVFNFEWE